MKIREITLYRVDLPLSVPYRLSYHTFESFQPIVAEVRDEDGRIGWGEGHISPGSSDETRDGGWAYAREHAERVLGVRSATAKAAILATMERSQVAATALVTAIEMLERHRLLELAEEVRWPLLAAVNGRDEAAIEAEIEARLAEGFKTFKVKVGKDVEADLAQVDEFPMIGERRPVRYSVSLIAITSGSAAASSRKRPTVLRKSWNG